MPNIIDYIDTSIDYRKNQCIGELCIKERINKDSYYRFISRTDVHIAIHDKMINCLYGEIIQELNKIKDFLRLSDGKLLKLRNRYLEIISYLFDYIFSGKIVDGNILHGTNDKFRGKIIQLKDLIEIEERRFSINYYVGNLYLYTRRNRIDIYTEAKVKMDIINVFYGKIIKKLKATLDLVSQESMSATSDGLINSDGLLNVERYKLERDITLLLERICSGDTLKESIIQKEKLKQEKKFY